MENLFTQQLLLSFAERTAVITGERERISYTNLFDFTEELYSHIGRRCLVFSLCSNTTGSLYGYVSFLTKKIVPLLLDATLDKELLASLIQKYRPAFCWLPEERLVDFDGYEIVFRSSGYVLVRHTNEEFPLHDDLALLFTTSGSTGSPRLVRISYKNISANAESIASYLSLTQEERPITVLPMHYSYGLSVINSHLLKGATILLTDRSLMEKEFWSLVKEEKATSLSGVPYTYEMLKKLRFEKMSLPSVTTMTQAGGKLSDQLCTEFAGICSDTGRSFFIMYGQTEATARISYLPPEYAVSKTGSIGKAIPGGSLQLIDEEGNVIDQPGQVGELIYYGPNVSMGYAGEGGDLSRGDESNGILNTHDLARRDDDGFYYIAGRRSRFVKLFGNRTSLDEIEQMVKQLGIECACVGTDDQLIIYITDPGRETEVYEYIISRTRINRKAFTVKYIPVIPKNSAGKILYANLATV